MKYRKKPVVIEAFRYRAGEYHTPQWAVEALHSGILYFDFNFEQGGLFIKTLEGNHHVSVGDYIIKGVKGELYPCKPDIFELTYELVEDDHE